MQVINRAALVRFNRSDSALYGCLQALRLFVEDILSSGRPFVRQLNLLLL